MPSKQKETTSSSPLSEAFARSSLSLSMLRLCLLWSLDLSLKIRVYQQTTGRSASNHDGLEPPLGCSCLLFAAFFWQIETILISTEFLINQPTNQPTTTSQPTNQPTNHNQSTNQPTNQPTNQS